MDTYCPALILPFDPKAHAYLYGPEDSIPEINPWARNAGKIVRVTQGVRSICGVEGYWVHPEDVRLLEGDIHASFNARYALCAHQISLD